MADSNQKASYYKIQKKFRKHEVFNLIKMPFTKVSYRNIARQIAPVGLGFLAMLILTNGKPSGFTVGLCFFSGIVFVSRNHIKDIIQSRQLSKFYSMSRGTKEQRIVVKALNQWHELHDEDRAWIANVGGFKQINNDYILLEQGKAIDELYIVLRGEFGVLVDELGENIVAKLSDGAVVGEMSFVRRPTPPSATVKALKDSLVWSIPWSCLEQKLQSDTTFAVRFYKALACALSERLGITTLVQLSEEYGKSNVEGHSLTKTSDQLLDGEQELDAAMLSIQYVRVADQTLDSVLQKVQKSMQDNRTVEKIYQSIQVSI